MQVVLINHEEILKYCVPNSLKTQEDIKDYIFGNDIAPIKLLDESWSVADSESENLSDNDES
ncbi:MAG: hypothetical protein LBT46_09905 [Planctomycetaceae bacterium]|jgi:hypothetical protein|nr:hypothetical protein [Planctomycetaceae bacterium]